MPLLILVILISMLVAIFAMQNLLVVTLNFVFWSFEASLVLVILGSFLMGLLAATFFMLMMKARHYLADKKLKNELQRLETENKRLNEKITMLQHAQLLQAKPGVETEDVEKPAPKGAAAVGKP